jgi:hypothetical protein
MVTNFTNINRAFRDEKIKRSRVVFQGNIDARREALKNHRCRWLTY